MLRTYNVDIRFSSQSQTSILALSKGQGLFIYLQYTTCCVSQSIKQILFKWDWSFWYRSVPNLL